MGEIQSPVSSISRAASALLPSSRSVRPKSPRPVSSSKHAKIRIKKIWIVCVEKVGDFGVFGVGMSATGHSLPGFIYQHQISKIDKRSNALSGNKNWVSSMDGIGQYDEAAE